MMSNAETIPSLIELPSLEHPDAWEEPILFDEAETPVISASWLPPLFAEFAAALSHATETPEALSVMTVLGVLSACAAKRFTVSPKMGWEEPVNLYILIALPPGNNKTRVLNSCTQPLVAWEKEQATLLDRKIKEQRAERKNQEKAIELSRIHAAKERDAEKRKKLFQDIVEKELQLTEAPVLPVLFANDATPESLASSAYEQGGRFAVFSDEGGILETLAGLYSHGVANVDILLKGIDGGEIRVRRKDRSFHLNPYLTMVLTVQPTVIQTMAEKRAYLGNGTLERFLYVLPKSKLGYRTHDTPAVSVALQLAYAIKIHDLLNQPPLLDERGQEQARTLTLSAEAQAAWRKFQLNTEEQLCAEGKLVLCQGWGGKICGFALRIAGLLHIAEADMNDLTITVDTMNNALNIANALIDHAITAFKLMGVEQTTEDAKTILQWILSQKKTSFTKSEITLAMRNKKCGKGSRLAASMNILIERNLISHPIKSPTRKPTTFYYVHPAILSSHA
jgi:hypothetical protein